MGPYQIPYHNLWKLSVLTSGILKTIECDKFFSITAHGENIVLHSILNT